MLLRCPHCHARREQARSDFLGDWVVCPVCELPFAWRDSGLGECNRAPAMRSAVQRRTQSNPQVSSDPHGKEEP